VLSSFITLRSSLTQQVQEIIAEHTKIYHIGQKTAILCKPTTPPSDIAHTVVVTTLEILIEKSRCSTAQAIRIDAHAQKANRSILSILIESSLF